MFIFFIVVSKAVDAALYMRWNPGFILQFLNLQFVLWRPVSFHSHLYYSFLSLGWNYNHVHTWSRCISPLCLMWWLSVSIHLSKIFPSFVVLGSAVVQNTSFVYLLTPRSVSESSSLVDCIPCLLIFRCMIAVLPDFSKFFLIIFYVRLGQVFLKPCFIAFSRLAAVGMKSARWRYCDSFGLVFLVQYVVCHIFWFLCYQGYLSHCSLIVSGTFNDFLSIFLYWHIFIV